MLRALNICTDQYVNALFIPDGAPYSVPFDLDTARAGAPEHRPVGRRYTIRRWDPVDRRVTIDFVVHGDTGFAGRWANHAEVGDRLQEIRFLDDFAALFGERAR
jgi:NADPH-dependent ferric siderophore reductase